MRSIFLQAEWRKLAIANYIVNPNILKPWLPFGTELDFWNNKCFVSLIGFRFINTRIRGITIPFHRNFEEVNLRFYVKYNDHGIWKRGVCFIKEIVSKPAMSFVANSIYKEKYITLPTKYTWTGDADYLRVNYGWKHDGSWDTISVTAQPFASKITPGSAEEFITEHYWGYTRINNNSSSQYAVEHPPWQTYPVNDYHIKVRFGSLYGKEFSMLNEIQPDSVMLVEGSNVTVRMFDKIIANASK